ncbi:hypothetical protein ALP94_101041 [Pseudomonas savastanoi pv. glycinea]|nr:hypothetical protein ALP94_101041 [Pseudomonas savastanoi pv. glycinea]
MYRLTHRIAGKRAPTEEHSKSGSGICWTGDALKKNELPVKTCVVCGLPFTWRKKWARCWDEVRYCSERCRRNKRAEH